MCTRLLIRAKVYERLFCIFDTSRPFEAALTVEKQTPGTTFSMAPTIAGGHFGTTFVPQYETRKTVHYRLEAYTIEQARAIVQRVVNKQFCLRCNGHPSTNCTKRMFKSPEEGGDIFPTEPLAPKQLEKPTPPITKRKWKRRWRSSKKEEENPQ